MHRFFVPPSAIQGDTVAFAREQARQLARVLRARPGQRVVVLDDSGLERLVRLTVVGPREALGKVEETVSGRGEPSLRLVLYMAVLKGDRFELVLQKGTELGVAAFVPVLFARSVSRPDAMAWARGRRGRWERILREAAEQSGRSRLPRLGEPMTLEEAASAARGLRLAPWEGEGSRSLRSLLEGLDGPPGEVSLLVGPEGGFEPWEVEVVRSRGFHTVGLGPRILRAETAAIVSTALVMHHGGQMEGGPG